MKNWLLPLFFTVCVGYIVQREKATMAHQEAGLRIRLPCLEINQEFARLALAHELDLVQINCGSAPNTGDGDTLIVELTKIRDNLRSLP